jgi:exopolysaccharide/PEP-CTERM locus tyrosine autokinase
MGKIYEALERADKRPSETENKVAKFVRPQLELSPDLVVVQRPGAAIAEQFRFLRSKVIRPGADDAPRTILVTSALQAEGKTFVASNLAATISQGLDEYVLLVDADLRKPQVHNIFGIPEPEQGLSSHLRDGVPLQDVLCKTGIDKLTILPAGSSGENPVELLASQRMKSFIAEVRDRYPDRVVIFDSPPMELAPESLVMAKEVDGVFLVLKRAATPRDVVRSSLEKLDQDRFLGVILNRDKQTSKLYRHYKGKNESYGYGYGYGYSYGDKG